MMAATNEVLDFSVWRPLIGPNDDWPLAICDWTTVDPENDILLNDAIRRDRVDENSLLHHNEAHKWHYINGQNPSDLFVFRNVDSFGRRPRKSPSCTSDQLVKADESM